MKEWFINLDNSERFWVILTLVAVIYFGLLNPNQIDWTVDTTDDWTVLAYPNDANTKNYELPAEMEITEYKHGFRHNYIKYNVKKVTFPNEGYLEFDDCTVRNQIMATCTDQRGEEWGIKVLVTPDKPDTDSGSDY